MFDPIFHQSAQILPWESTMLYCLKLARLEYLSTSLSIWDENLLWSMFQWHGSCYVSPLVASIMAKFEQILREHFGNISKQKGQKNSG